MLDNEGAEDTLLALTADIVAAHVSNNSVSVNDVPTLIQNVHATLSTISDNRSAPEAKPEPKVPVRSSIKPDYIVCLEDGKRFKSLKRHLHSEHGLSPQEYREKWGLAKDYPMVAPAYAAKRSELAKTIGLGRKAAGEVVSEPEPAPAEAPKKRGRAKTAA